MLTKSEYGLNIFGLDKALLVRRDIYDPTVKTSHFVVYRKAPHKEPVELFRAEISNSLVKDDIDLEIVVDTISRIIIS